MRFASKSSEDPRFAPLSKVSLSVHRRRRFRELFLSYIGVQLTRQAIFRVCLRFSEFPWPRMRAACQSSSFVQVSLSALDLQVK